MFSAPNLPIMIDPAQIAFCQYYKIYIFIYFMARRLLKLT
jgi:hypothetical protein